MEKTILTLIISCVNYRTLHVKQPDVASGVRPETKPLVNVNVGSEKLGIISCNQERIAQWFHSKDGHATPRGGALRDRYENRCCAGDNRWFSVSRHSK